MALVLLEERLVPESKGLTEAEWLSGSGPRALLGHLGDRASERKLRLFDVACCRRISHLLRKGRGWAAVELAERLADGQASTAEAEALGASLAPDISARYPPDWASVAALNCLSLHPLGPAPELTALSVGMEAFGGQIPSMHQFLQDLLPRLFTLGGRASGERGGLRAGWDAFWAEQARQCDLVRDIFGNPFRPVSADPSWRTWNDGCVAKIAQGIYDERRFTDLPVLADALLDAGCDDENVLAHCRSAGEHVRGCWVVDAVLGKN
jgi:hypothetical protein